MYAAVCGLSSGLSVGSISVSQTVYAVPFLVGSAVVEFLSVLCANCVNTEPGMGCAWSQWAPPSVERAAATALKLLG